MTTCNYCRNENPDSANYCGRCGRRLREQRTLLTLNKSTFCYECGNRRESYPNDRRICTVLFADVHGYTAMTEKMDVEKVTSIMNEVFSLLTGEIIGVGGSVDKYQGDNIMARFGAPEALEDHPERAIRAAIGMQRQLSQFSRRLQKDEGVGLEMRIGLNTGWVNAAEVGGEVDGVSYRTYTVMGDTVNLASRLEHESRVGKILVGDETFKLAKHAFDFVDTGERQIRGKREPVRAFEVIGPKPQRANRRGLVGKDLQLIGREEELGLLWTRFSAAMQGKGQVVSVTGEAGVGKSSLLREFKRRATNAYPDLRYISGAAFSYSANQPFSLVRNAIFKLCDINDNDDEEAVKEKLLAQVSLLMGESNQNDEEEYGELAAFLGRAVGINLHNSFVENLDPLLRSRLLSDSISDFLLKKAETSPLMIVLDDLHWADNSSLEVLDRMVQKVVSESSEMQAMLLLLHRPDFNRVWVAQPSHYEQIGLERLTPEQVTALARQMLEVTAGLPPSLVNVDPDILPRLPENLVQMVERANGNPFFAEEILKALLDAKQIIQDPQEAGGWRVVGDLDNFKLPETLQEILLARVDKLVGRDKRVLQVASVIGPRFEQRLLLAVDNFSQQQAQVEEAITDLHNEDFVYTERQEPEPEYAFRHSLTREVAYNNLLEAERKQFHQQIAQAIELFKFDRLHDFTVLDDLAYHYNNTDDNEKAIFYLQQAGHLRKNLYRNDEALKAYYEAKERFKRQRQPEARRQVEVNTNIGEILALKADYAGALTNFLEALELTRDPNARIDLWARVIQVQGRRGDLDEALDTYNKADNEYRAVVKGKQPEPGLTQIRAKLLTQVGLVYYRQGRGELALNAFKETLDLLNSLNDDDRNVQVDIGRAYANLGTVFSEIGQLDDAEISLTRALEIFEHTSNMAEVARTYSNLAVIMIIRCNLVQASNFLKMARTNAEKVGDAEALGSTIGNLGYVAERQGQLVGAFKYYQEARRIFERDSNLILAASAQENCGRILLQQGKIQEALEYFDTGLKMAETIGSTVTVAEGCNNSGWAYLLSGNLGDAQEWLSRGYAKSMESGSPEVLANNNMYRGMLEIELGDYPHSATFLDESVKIIEEQLGDPSMLGQVRVQQGRLAFKQRQYEQAAQFYAASLEALEPPRAYLEMCYTKMYWAELILQELQENLVERAKREEQVEKGLQFLMQACFTFDACEAQLAYEKANKLLDKFKASVPTAD